MLICATDYEDAFDKLKMVVERCRERNIFLKLSKSWFGFDHAEFFGYFCQQGSYRLTSERINEVTSIPFPTGNNKLRKLQRFLGCAVFFKPFIFDYSTKTAVLTEMTAKNFSWDKSSWKKDYVAAFEAFKADILHSFTLFHPDYTLPWFLYVDASDVAVGGVLIQVTVEGIQQVIAFVSKKFTTTSCRWSTIEKEAFSMFYTCMKLRYYLFAKEFTMLTDHNNLLWMEASEVPKIIRMRIYLQEFNFKLVHVAGKSNVFADWLSRMFEPDTVNDEAKELLQLLDEEEEMVSSVQMLSEIQLETPGSDKLNTVLGSVHNARMGHHGAYRTWILLNKHYPGHGIPVRMVQDFIRECPFCQKVRETVNASLQAPTRAIVADHPRHFCGYDTLYITPADGEGFQYLHVFKLIPSRLVALYPSKTLSAESLASAAFQFFVTYGITDVLITDPGSNITSEVMKLLLDWFGIRMRISLVGRHQSNAVERTHREILRFLTTLVNTEDLKKIWSKPHVLGIIQFLINSEKSSETGVSPFQYVFGSTDSEYMILPASTGKYQANYLEMLNEDLFKIREAAKKVQELEQRKRNKDAVLNTYVAGDYVLFDEASRGFREQKLKPRYSGPYLVISVCKADISCKHIVTGKEKVFHMEHLKPFIGSLKDAFDAAKSDDDQYVIVEIIDYRGDPDNRSNMEFLIHFEDDEIVWLRYNADLSSSTPFQVYISSHRELEPLTLTAAEWKITRSRYNRQGVVGVQPGDTCFVLLKSWGVGYFQSLLLPNGPLYVVECVYVKWTTAKKKKIDVRCPLFNDEIFEWDATAVRMYGMSFILSSQMVLVDSSFCQRYPKILG